MQPWVHTDGNSESSGGGSASDSHSRILSGSVSVLGKASTQCAVVNNHEAIYCMLLLYINMCKFHPVMSEHGTESAHRGRIHVQWIGLFEEVCWIRIILRYRLIRRL